MIDNEVSGSCNVYEKKKKMFDVVIKSSSLYRSDVHKLKIIFFYIVEKMCKTKLKDTTLFF